MKKLVISSALSCALSVFAIANVSAQVQLPEITVTSTASGSEVSAKVTKAFSETFKNVKDVRWYEINKRYLVKFIMDDLRNHAVYAKNGHLIYQITYGFEKNLPMDLSAQVKDKYYSYDIVSAINIKQDGHNAWIVNLEDIRYLLMVRLADGDMSEIKRLTKSSPQLDASR
ncbi:hypothetical protein [Solitalea lacus]|uniref:hypothetical protein n=1 Tax=Solitalea lacus TaxID=2911172 RepID=UPI001EDA852F|nr:hypothetical protein [Solitalea lacus]UKJ06496.1 hypothetical protein L2B55_13245 [Solitalea lacus]